MSLTFRKLGVLALVGAVLLVLGALRPGVGGHTPTAEADIMTPGGAAALPSWGPGLPGVIDQALPAVIPANSPGNRALIGAFCDPTDPFFCDFGNGFLEKVWSGGQLVDTCQPKTGGAFDGLSQYCFHVAALDMSTPAASPSGMKQIPARAKFAASNDDILICTDGATCDLDPLSVGSVWVALVGGGQDELLQVEVNDESGQRRELQVITVQTMIAVPPVMEPMTEIIPGLSDMAIVSYRCPDVGRAVFTVLPGINVVSTLEEMANFIYGAPFLPIGVGNPNAFFRCGGNTNMPAETRVQFATDIGMFVNALVALPFPLFLPGMDCPQGKNVSIADSNVTWPLFPPGAPVTIENCDLDAAPNGVVTYMLMRQETGMATITAQQGTLANSADTETINWVGVSGAAPLFLQLKSLACPQVPGAAAGSAPADCDLGEMDLGGDLPTSLAVLEEIDFAAVTLSGQVNPVAGMTIACKVDPANSVFILFEDRVTTGSDGIARFQLVPTGPGPLGDFTLSCEIVGHPEVGKQTHDFTVGLAVVTTEEIDLVGGACNNLPSTFADGTKVEDVAEAIDPADALDAIWKYNASTNKWLGYAPGAPAAANDLKTLDFLEAFYICLSEDATLTQPQVSQ